MRKRRYEPWRLELALLATTGTGAIGASVCALMLDSA